MDDYIRHWDSNAPAIFDAVRDSSAATACSALMTSTERLGTRLSSS